jgi:hypothetical protein
LGKKANCTALLPQPRKGLLKNGTALFKESENGRIDQKRKN